MLGDHKADGRNESATQFLHSLFETDGLRLLFPQDSTDRIAGLWRWDDLLTQQSVFHFGAPQGISQSQREMAAEPAAQPESPRVEAEDAGKAWQSPTPVNGYVAHREQWL